MGLHSVTLIAAIAGWFGVAFGYFHLSGTDRAVDTLGRAMFFLFGIVIGELIPLLLTFPGLF